MDDFILREARLEDAEAIAFVHVRTWQEAYRGLIPDEFLDALSVEKRATVWRDWLSDARENASADAGVECVRLAVREGHIVGFVNAGGCRDEDASHDVGEVRAIYVLPDHWDIGAGGALMKAALDWLRSRYRTATLWVLDGNVRARQFYEQFGWYFDGTEKDDDSRGFVLREVRYRVALDRA